MVRPQVFAFESNLGFEAQHLTRAVVLGGVRNWTAMLEGPRGTVGWLTTNATKEKSCLTTRSALNQGTHGSLKLCGPTILTPEPF